MPKVISLDARHRRQDQDIKICRGEGISIHIVGRPAGGVLQFIASPADPDGSPDEVRTTGTIEVSATAPQLSDLPSTSKYAVWHVVDNDPTCLFHGRLIQSGAAPIFETVAVSVTFDTTDVSMDSETFTMDAG